MYLLIGKTEVMNKEGYARTEMKRGYTTLNEIFKRKLSKYTNCSKKPSYNPSRSVRDLLKFHLRQKYSQNLRNRFNLTRTAHCASGNTESVTNLDWNIPDILLDTSNCSVQKSKKNAAKSERFRTDVEIPNQFECWLPSSIDYSQLKSKTQTSFARKERVNSANQHAIGNNNMDDVKKYGSTASSGRRIMDATNFVTNCNSPLLLIDYLDKYQKSETLKRPAIESNIKNVNYGIKKEKDNVSEISRNIWHDIPCYKDNFYISNGTLLEKRKEENDSDVQFGLSDISSVKDKNEELEDYALFQEQIYVIKTETKRSFDTHVETIEKIQFKRQRKYLSNFNTCKTRLCPNFYAKKEIQPIIQSLWQQSNEKNPHSSKDLVINTQTEMVKKYSATNGMKLKAEKSTKDLVKHTSKRKRKASPTSPVKLKTEESSKDLLKYTSKSNMKENSRTSPVKIRTEVYSNNLVKRTKGKKNNTNSRINLKTEQSSRELVKYTANRKEKKNHASNQMKLKTDVSPKDSLNCTSNGIKSNSATSSMKLKTDESSEVLVKCSSSGKGKKKSATNQVNLETEVSTKDLVNCTPNRRKISHSSLLKF